MNLFPAQYIPSRPALRTLRLSATGPRTLATLIATTATSGAGSFIRIAKYYKRNNLRLEINPALGYGFKPAFPSG